jgi:peptide deformylase
MQNHPGLEEIIDDLWITHPLFARVTIERLVLRTASQMHASQGVPLTAIRRAAREQIIYVDPDPDPDPRTSWRGPGPQRSGRRTDGVRSS